MRMQSETEGGWLTVFSLSGEMDAASAPEFRDALSETIEQDLIWILVDLSEVEYIDSVGLGMLMGAAKRANEHGGGLAVICQRPNLLKIFDITGTRELLNVCEAESQAREFIERNRAAGGPGAEEGGRQDG